MGEGASVRPLRASDRDAWLRLWDGYLGFYEAALPADVTELTWRRLLDESEPLHSVVAEVGGQAVGFAHFLLHRSTWARHCYCYLEDLFVAPEKRGGGLGELLIREVEAEARKAGANRLYWVTRADNARAQRVYDKLASRSDFIQYRKVLD